MRQAQQREAAAGNLAWSEREVGSAQLGDARRTRRAVQMLADAAASPHGKPGVALSEAGRQAAYDFLESDGVKAQALLEAAARGAWARATGSLVYVPLDQCTLTLAEASLAKGFGWTDNGRAKTCGAETLNAPLLREDGVPLGLVGHAMWVRQGPARAAGTDTRALALGDKETRHWIAVAEAVVAGWKASGFSGTPWLQLDAGADAREVLEWMAWGAQGARVSVRCAQRTRLCLGPQGQEGHLEEVLLSQAPRRPYRLAVPASEKRTARRARMVVRWCSVVVQLRQPTSEALLPVQLWAVHAREEGSVPEGEDALDWLLLTNAPVTCRTAALAVIHAYTLRWRVEEVHRAWKKTGCRVEQSALHYEAFRRWALMLLCVAVRIERLKRLSREAPDTRADTEFSPHELRALLLLKHQGALYTQGYVPTLGEAVLWIAQLGGYTSLATSHGPPGATTLRRGLDKLAPAAEALRVQEELGG